MAEQPLQQGKPVLLRQGTYLYGCCPVAWTSDFFSISELTIHTEFTEHQRQSHY